MRRKKRYNVDYFNVPENSKSGSLRLRSSSPSLGKPKSKRKKKNQPLRRINPQTDEKRKIPICSIFPTQFPRASRLCPKRCPECDPTGDLVDEAAGEVYNKNGDENGRNDDELRRIAIIESAILCERGKLSVDDIVGLGLAKEVIRETVIWPLLRPELFTGLRTPPKGILLFGPAGTGKTLIGKSIASETNSTFFDITPSAITSKWMGESEKLVRTLFNVARERQPSIIFLDEVDALLSLRTLNEGPSVRRMKNEFLIQMDGTATCDDDKIIIIGATNRPQELDEEARRRFHKRLYIALPDECGRREILGNLLNKESHTLTMDDLDDVARRSYGFSGDDVRNLCHEAAMGPIRDISPRKFPCIPKDKMRPITLCDFLRALKRIKCSISRREVYQYEKWDKQFGSGSGF